MSWVVKDEVLTLTRCMYFSQILLKISRRSSCPPGISRRVGVDVDGSKSVPGVQRSEMVLEGNNCRHLPCTLS